MKSNQPLDPRFGQVSVISDDVVRRGLALLDQLDRSANRALAIARDLKLYPSVRPTIEFDHLLPNPNTPPLVGKGWLPNLGLSVYLAADEPDMIRLVRHDHLTSWGLSEEQAWNAAFTNLEESSQSAVLNASHQFCSVIGWNLSGHLEALLTASLFLLPRFRARLCKEVGTKRCVVGIPNRHLLIALDPSMPNATTIIGRFRHDVLLFERGLTATPFLVFENGDFLPMDSDDIFMASIGRMPETVAFDVPLMGLPNIWQIGADIPFEPWTRYVSTLYSIEHPVSWRVTTENNLTSFWPSGGTGVLHVSAYIKNSTDPVEIHECLHFVQKTYSQLGAKPTSMPVVRLMNNWKGLYTEYVQQTNGIIYYDYVLGACRGNTWILATVIDSEPNPYQSIEYARIFDSLLLMAYVK